MLRTLRIALSAAVVLALAPAIGLAKSPGLHDFAVNANVGFARSFDGDFDDLEPLFSAAVEFYLTEHVSLRAIGGFTSFDAQIAGTHNEADVAFATVGAAYNWLDGPIHPFVAGGAGLYDREFNGPAVAASDEGIELGIHAGGGLDFSFNSQWAIRVEGQFHGMSGDEPDSFFAGTVGAKYRF
jgi:opacity protein-like surface antigen